MKWTLFGFELEFAFGPTTQTLIRYREWQTRMQHWRCRFRHDTTWVLYPRFPDRRWYCCRDCKTTWLEPTRGHGSP